MPAPGVTVAVLVGLVGIGSTVGCFRHPRIGDGSTLQCVSDEYCLPGYVCARKADSLATELGHCVKPDGATADSPAPPGDTGVSETWAPIDGRSGVDRGGVVDTGNPRIDGGTALDSGIDWPTMPDLLPDLPPDVGSPWLDGQGMTAERPVDNPISWPDGPASDIPLSGSGGMVGSGGSPGTGGVYGTGGGPGTGGATAAGGASGTGGAAGSGGATGSPPNLISSTASLSLGPAPTGERSTVGTFTITNIGQQTSGPLSLSSTSAVFVLEGGASDGCVSGITSLASLSSCTVRVAFAPVTVGDQSALIAFSVVPGNSGGVSVSGTGTPGALLSTGATAFSFPLTTVGRSTTAQSFTIANSGARPSGGLAVSSSSPDFVVQGGEPTDCTTAPVAAGASCVVRVVFVPSVAGSRSGSVTFQAAPGGGGSVSVAGSACAAGTHDDGTGACALLYTCAAGYHKGSTGICIVNAACPADQLTDESGICVPQAGVSWTMVDATRRWNELAGSADLANLIAADVDGYLYTSSDSGAHWTQRASGQSWTGVASSADGARLIAAAYGGYLYVSSDGGQNWSTRENQRDWTSVASSATGDILVAAARVQPIFVSGDLGVSWPPHGSPADWTSVAASADGRTLLAGASDGSLRLSTDGGQTWGGSGPGAGVVWPSVAVSASGTKLFAVTSGASGSIFTSTNSGTDWSSNSSLGGSWSFVGCSADGSRVLASASESYSARTYTSFDSGATWTIRSLRSVQALVFSADATKMLAVVYDWETNGRAIWMSTGPVP